VTPAFPARPRKDDPSGAPPVPTTRRLLRERIQRAREAGLHSEQQLRRALPHHDVTPLVRRIDRARRVVAEAEELLAELDRTGTPERVVVVPCGGRKLDRPAPAGRMYVGGYHRACRAYAERVGADRVLILSARHGLLELHEVVEPYDLRMGQKGSVDADTLREQAARLGVLDAEVVVLGGRPYTRRALEVWPEARLPLEGCRSMGEQLRRMKCGPDELLEAADRERAARTTADP
jgi:hypothetical protein